MAERTETEIKFHPNHQTTTIALKDGDCPIDTGVVELVKLLDGIDGFQTISSCQGEATATHWQNGHVLLRAQRGCQWVYICHLAFDRMRPITEASGALIGVRWSHGKDAPVLDIEWHPNMYEHVLSAAKAIFQLGKP